MPHGRILLVNEHIRTPYSAVTGVRVRFVDFYRGAGMREKSVLGDVSVVSME